MMDRREWERKLMDEKGVACNDNDWRQGTAKTVVHRNSIKEHLLYEASQPKRRRRLKDFSYREKRTS